jgi:hypothetical protein
MTALRTIIDETLDKHALYADLAETTNDGPIQSYAVVKCHGCDFAALHDDDIAQTVRAHLVDALVEAIGDKP